MSVEKEVLLKVNKLKKYFFIKKGLFLGEINVLKAVDDISFTINRGEVMSLVGESGCGKTTTAETIILLQKPTAGEAWFNKENIFSLNTQKLRKMREKIQLVFQDPYSSLNPRIKVGEIIGEPLDIHHLIKNKKEKNEKIKKIMDEVGLHYSNMKKFPYEFSGGQRQRIGIARALVINPQLIIADEPLSALDVSIQAKIINLLMDLKSKYNLTYLFISHDLSVVKHISDKIAVMYLGKIVEEADKNDLFSNPLHPYTQALLSAVPIPNPKFKKKKIILRGSVPNLINLPSGCSFHTRCPKVMDICSKVKPKLKEYGKNHFVSCHLYN